MAMSSRRLFVRQAAAVVIGSGPMVVPPAGSVAAQDRPLAETGEPIVPPAASGTADVVGRQLFVNAEVPDGTLRAEVLDANGQPIEPFTPANRVPLTGDRTLAPMAWADGSDLGSLRGQPVRFRFRLAGGSLDAFWVSRDDAGRSDGYRGAGGPGYEGGTDTVGRAAVEAIQSEAGRF